MIDEIRKFIEWQAQGDRRVDIRIDGGKLEIWACDRKLSASQIVHSFSELNLEQKRRE